MLGLTDPITDLLFQLPGSDQEHYNPAVIPNGKLQIILLILSNPMSFNLQAIIMFYSSLNVTLAVTLSAVMSSAHFAYVFDHH